MIGPPETTPEAAAGDLDRLLQAALADQPPAAAAALVAARLGLPKRQVYRRALALKETRSGSGENGR